MKDSSLQALSADQLSQMTGWLREQILSAQIQEIWLWGQAVMLDCYRGESFTLAMDLDPQRPGLFLCGPLRVKQTPPKPMISFLRAHLRGKRFTDIEVHEPLDRIVHLYAGPVEMTLELIPRSPNLFAVSKTSEGEKKISWAKPLVRPAAAMQVGIGASGGGSSAKDADFWLARSQAWLDARLGKVQRVQGSHGGPAPVGFGLSASAQDPRLRLLEKKKAALAKLNERDLHQSARELRELGAQLKSYLGISGAEYAWRRLLEQNRDRVQVEMGLSLQQSIDVVFEKAKQLERKQEGALERARTLEAEIAQLADALATAESAEGSGMTPRGSGGNSDRDQVSGDGLGEQPHRSQRPTRSSRDEGSANMRTLRLASGLVAFIGKSAADNLKILRQARAWDYWLHLKDGPSAYVILKRDKGQTVSDQDLREAAVWLASQSKVGKIGEEVSADVVVVECRHVKPIKGDRLGRATYQNPLRVLRVTATRR